MKFRIRPVSDFAKGRKLAKRLKLYDMDISIEYAKDQIRPHANGHTVMSADYGYIRRTEGLDGEHIDCYVGPHKESERVFIINQMKYPDFEEFDEQKVMLCYNTPEQAHEAYCAHYDDERFVGSMVAMRLRDFKKRIFSATMRGVQIEPGGKIRILPPVMVLSKADKPPAGFMPVKNSKRGGYKKRIGRKWVYWYPGQAHPKAAKKKPTRSRPTAPKRSRRGKPNPTHDPAPSGAQAGDTMPSFSASRATPGTIVHKLENGHFKWMKRRRVEKSADEHEMRRTELVPGLRDADKMEVIEAFKPLVSAEAKRAQILYGLTANKAEARRELRHAGVEGLLLAIHSYRPDVPFAQHARMIVRDHVRLAAARESLGGVNLPPMHTRNLGRYIIARSRAGKELQKDNPTPRDVVPFFDLRKKHIHAGLPVKDHEGKSLRNDQVPNFEGYDLGLGRHGEGGSSRTQVQQPSKLAWAEMYEGFLSGQKGVDVFDEDVLLPGAHVGYGLDVDELVTLRHAVAKAQQKISQMGASTVEHQLTGTKKPAQFRIDSMSELLMRRLGVGHEPHSARELADEITFYKVKPDGSMKPVGQRNAIELAQVFTEKGMKQFTEAIDDRRAKRMAQRAAEVFHPKKVVPEGPTYHEILAKEAKQVVPAQIKSFRKRHKVSKSEMSDQEVSMEIAKSTRGAQRARESMRKAMVQTMDVERLDSHYGVAYFRDEKGRMQSRRVRLTYDKDFKKSLDHLTHRMFHDAINYPEVSEMVTKERKFSLDVVKMQRTLGWY